MCGSAEKVGVVPSKCDTAYASQNFAFRHNIHSLNRQFGQSSVSCSNNNISVGHYSQGSDTHRKKFFYGSQSFEYGSFDVNFEYITGFCSDITELIWGVDRHGSELSFQISEIYVKRLDLKIIFLVKNSKFLPFY